MRLCACLALVGLVALAGCGGSDNSGQTPPRSPNASGSTTKSQPEQQPQGQPPSSQPPQPNGKLPPPRAARKPDPAATKVIRAWTDALRHGHVRQAANYFAIPSIVQNASPPIEVKTRAQALAFNASLPCGAVFRRAVGIGRFTVVVFKLTNRPGGDCAQGAGHAAGTAFVVKHGKITEWRRVDENDVPPVGVVPSTGRRPPEAPQLPPGSKTVPQAPQATGPTI